jgi:branched-chain amino acid aminotransferase
MRRTGARGFDVFGTCAPRFHIEPLEREICRANGIPARETTFSLTDVYAAREAFVTGTFAGVVPVCSVDGRTIGDSRRGPMVEGLQALYHELVDADVASRVAP